MTFVYILSILNLIAVAYLISKSKNQDRTDEIIKKLTEIEDRNEKITKQEFSLNRQEFGPSFNNFSIKLDQLVSNINLNLNQVRESVEKRLQLIQKDNSDQLEKMRATVDEKLQSTLEKRLGESFKQVSTQLESVYKGLGEMNAQELRDTTMEPEFRVFQQATIEDALGADEMFEALIGKDVGIRKNLITHHAKEVTNIDI